MRTRIAVGVVGVVLALAAPASAQGVEDESGIGVGPSRQMVETGAEWTRVFVSNAGARPIKVKLYPYVNVDKEWVQRSAGITYTPASFTLQPRQQQPVTVRVTSASQPCALVGLAARIVHHEGQATTGFIPHAQSMGQLLVQGRQGSEAACVDALRRAAPVAASRTQPFPYWIIVMALAIAFLLWGAKRWHKRRQPRRRKAYGF